MPDVPAQTGPAFIAVGSIFLDDIVFPNGRTFMGVLGGGAAHAAAGMAIWDQRAGIVACMGRDLPESAHQRLARDYDLGGVVWVDVPQARAWQVFEWDGRRTEIFRCEDMTPFVSGPDPSQVTPTYNAVRGVHLLQDADSVPGWRARCPDAVLLWEPQQQVMIPELEDVFRRALPFVDIVSPNQLEASQLYGFDEPVRLVQAMLADGASVAVLRMGEQGSLVGRRGHVDLLAVPAVSVPHIVDQTGAGNTYCGAFLVNWVITQNMVTAACRAAVAASFALEVLGVIDPAEVLPLLRDDRCAELHGQLLAQQPQG